MVNLVKGRTTCPKCKHDFVLDIEQDDKKHEIVCPKCKHKYNILAKCTDSKSEGECSWEEHGEPRKTILSKIKPKTNRPLIAVLLLICVFAIGITTAAIPETFIESTLDIGTAAGITGTLEIRVTDQFNNSIDNVSITVNDAVDFTDEKGVATFDDVELGIQTVELSKDEYTSQNNEIVVLPFVVTNQDITIENATGKVKNIDFDSTGCTLILAIFSVCALLAMITCLRRRHIDVAMAGSFLGIFSFGFLFIGSILSIIAFAIIWKSRDEFEDGKKGKIF